MNPKSRRNQPFVRSRKSLLSSRRTAGGELASRAGRVERASVEQLEARQLLFSLTITPDVVNPNTGIGQVTTYFGYILPVFDHTGMPAMVMDTTVNESFASEAAALPAQVVNGAIFGESNLQISHNITPGSNLRLEAEVPGQMGIEAQRLFVRGQQDMFFSFRVNPNNAGVFSPISSFTMTVANVPASAQGLPVDNMTVSLIFDGEVLQTFTGNQIPGNLGAITFQTDSGEIFDEIRFDFDSGTTLDGFYIDDLTYVRPGNAFGAMIEAQVFGAEVVFSGQVGDSVQFLDLYGRDMVNTIRLGTPNSGEVPLVDRNLNGVPDFNDGIGRVIFSNSSMSTSLSIFGGQIMAADMPMPEDEFFANGFAFQRFEDFDGIYGAASSLGLGYVNSTDGMRALGLPNRMGSVVIGAPFLRDNTNTATYNLPGQAPGPLDFNRADQGFFATGGQSVGTIYFHGTLYGSSQIDGNLERMNMEHLAGSFSIDGDVGGFIVGSDAGVWNPQNMNSPISVDTRRTGSQLNFGRTVREVFVGGRSGVDITVVGDLNAPGALDPKETYRYFEQEFTFGINPAPGEFENVIAAILANTSAYAVNLLNTVGAGPVAINGQSVFAGGTLVRNDTLGSAEWIGGIGSSAQVHGNLGFGDPVNSEDPSDVFAFASDGRTEIVLNLEESIPGIQTLVRILDANGRTVATFDANDQVILGQTVVRYRPDAPGIYYAVVAVPVDASITTGSSYVLTISGMAATTFGSYRTGAGLGARDADTLQNASATILSGNMGAVRVGTGIVDAMGMETNTQSFFFTAGNADIDASLRGGTVAVAGNLYAIWTGSDIEANTDLPSFTIGGDLGGLYVGMSPLFGLTPTEGDLGPSSFTVGGRIGVIDIKGRIGVDQDAINTPLSFFGVPVTITTGTGGGPGDIGLFRVGSGIASDHLIVNTSPGSTIGAFLTDQDTNPGAGAANAGIYQVFSLTALGATFNLGQGSDIRFVDFPRLDLTASFDLSIPIITNQPISLTDDAGGIITIVVPSTINNLLVGTIRVLPIDGSQGQAVGRIDVNLAGGLRLRVSSQNAGDSVTVGKINVTGSLFRSARLRA